MSQSKTSTASAPVAKPKSEETATPAESQAPQEAPTSPPTETEGQEPESPRSRTWKGRKRGFRLPARPAIPVKGLWQMATPEQREKAHRTATALMEYWLGRITKEQLCKALQVPPLRIWQLSQAAVSGLVAGLLAQPKTYSQETLMTPEENPKLLRKKIAELERTVAAQDRLIRIIRELPGVRQGSLPKAVREWPPEPEEGAPTQESISTQALEGGSNSQHGRKKRGRPRRAGKAASRATVPTGARRENGRAPDESSEAGSEDR